MQTLVSEMAAEGASKADEMQEQKEDWKTAWFAVA